ncbi:uncharacterized protein LOC128857504 [Anastrepha ludens]|uniref:uncharacterized protein LOC128857504 n=1 Tax=Anastrepha ludens TaxID=28586 RepID=UPI0023AECD36|nr:uncharacterized protein LOC128857504 [Anastrepha ludens]
MHVKSANFARSFAALLLLQTLLPQGADTKPVAAVKSLLEGMAMGTLGGIVLHHAVAKHMQHQTQQQQPIASQQPQLLSLPPQSPNVAEHQPNEYGQPQYPLLQAPHPAEQNSAQLGHPQFPQSAIQQPPQSGYPHLLQPVVQQPPQSGYHQLSQPTVQQPPQSGYPQLLQPVVQQPPQSGYHQLSQPPVQQPSQSGYHQLSQPAVQQPPQSGYPHLLQPVVQQPPQSGYHQLSQPAEQQPDHPQLPQPADQNSAQLEYLHQIPHAAQQQPPQPGHVHFSQPAVQHLPESVQQQPRSPPPVQQQSPEQATSLYSSLIHRLHEFNRNDMLKNSTTQEVQSPPTGGILDSLLQIKRPVDQPNTPQQQHQNAPQNPDVQAAPAAPGEQSAQPHPVIIVNQAPLAQDINKQPPQLTALHPAVVQPATVGGIPIQPVQHAQPPQPIYPVHPAQATSQVIIPSKKPGYFGKSSADKIPQMNFFLMAMMAFLLIWCK